MRRKRKKQDDIRKALEYARKVDAMLLAMMLAKGEARNVND